MTSKRFLALFGAGLALVAVAAIAFNVYVDLFGLFRPGRDRSLTVYGEERIAKYLYSFRYIPDNFDGVLLGSSVSDNFNLRGLGGYRVYNASIDGGNVLDMKPLVNNIYGRRDLMVTIICIHRYLTNDYLKKTDFMTPKEYWGALGSPQLMTAYLSRVAVKRNLVPGLYDELGTLNEGADVDDATVRSRIAQTVADIQRGTAAIGNFHVDPLAFDDLRSVIQTAREHSSKLIIFYPPTPAAILSASEADYLNYKAKIETLTKPSDIVIDFNAPEYSDIRDDYRNFADGVHLSRKGAALVVSDLGRVVEQSAGKQQARLN